MHVITCFVKFDTYWQIKVQLNFKGILKTNNFFYSYLICFSLLLHVFENVPYFLPSVPQRLPRSPANKCGHVFMPQSVYRALARWLSRNTELSRLFAATSKAINIYLNRLLEESWISSQNFFLSLVYEAGVSRCVCLCYVLPPTS